MGTSGNDWSQPDTAEPWAIALPATAAPPAPPGAPPWFTAPPAPASPPSPPPVSPTTDHWVWLMVALPVVAVVVQVATPGQTGLLWLGALVWNAVAALADRRDNPALAQRTSGTEMLIWAVLLSPVYVYKRQHALGLGLAPFWTFVGIAVSVIVLPLLLFTAVVFRELETMDPAWLEREIADGLAEQRDGLFVVTCPDAVPARVDATFTCAAESVFRPGQPERVRVRVTSPDGDVAWIVG